MTTEEVMAEVNAALGEVAALPVQAEALAAASVLRRALARFRTADL